MQRYIVPALPPDYKEKRFALTGEIHHHISRVLRMKEGELVFLVPDGGASFIAKIVAIDQNGVSFLWVEDELVSKEMPIHVSIASSLPKGDKLEWIVQKSTELGAAAFLPFESSNSVVKWDHAKKSKKVQRLQKIAQEAAEQSHRQRVPNVKRVHAFTELVASVGQFDAVLVAYEEEAKAGEAVNLVKVLNRLPENSSLLMIFGPEGGFSPDEVQTLLQAGAVACALGPRILRAETAPLYALAAISYQFELMMNGADEND